MYLLGIGRTEILSVYNKSAFLAHYLILGRGSLSHKLSNIIIYYQKPSKSLRQVKIKAVVNI